MKTMAILHSPKTGEQSDSPSWAKGGHNANHNLMKKQQEPYKTRSWGRRKTPSIDMGGLNQRMWKSTTVQHLKAHSTQLLNANTEESYTDRNGEITDSPSLCA